jgi:membrane peptidoglycan carboxypeptidase
MTLRLHISLFFASAFLLVSVCFARSVDTPTAKTTSSSSVTESAHARKRLAHHRHRRAAVHATKAKRRTSATHRTRATATVKTASVKTTRITHKRTRRHHYVERFTASSYATDITEGDVTDGEDPIVRQAAIDALGNMNGTVVAINPTDGRILAMVNQKLALSGGAEPCSTIKIAVALAALSEGVITKETPVQLGRHSQLTLTEALAHSNNAYFEAVGRRLGFERVSYYAHRFGLGELAGYHIPGEHLGEFPSQVLPEKLGGVGRMCSFGESISMTPLQLGALVSAIANGGTLYYLQHPTSPEEVVNFQPRVKRRLQIGDLVPEISPGMMGAVEYGTARSLRLNFSEEQILGKTGTCSQNGTRFGWFASYANTQYGRIVTVIFLEGGRPTYGPKAAEISGRFYRALYDHNFFAQPATAARRSGEGSSAVGAEQ